jgi:hypothetical protein
MVICANFKKKEADLRKGMKRREFLQLAAAGSTLCFSGSGLWPFGAASQPSRLISPGSRRTKVKVARMYLGTPEGLWPKPNLDFKKEIAFYEAEFAKLKEEISDVEFPVHELVTSPEQVARLQERLNQVDGILAIHFSIGIWPILQELLKAARPTMVFARPYSGHEWVNFGELRAQPLGGKMECILSSDLNQLAVALRPFRAIHHLREARILNLTTHDFSDYAAKVGSKFGTEIKQVTLERMVNVYNSISDNAAAAEADRWIKNAVQVVEPSKEDILRSSKLALAFGKLLDEETATVMTVDCYGSMWDKTIKLPAYPCLGFARLNDMGLGGICESDLRSAMTHIIFQGLAGRPGFVSDPTVDESRGSIILAHCLGTPKMDGPANPAAPYKIRTVMERQEGVVPQVEMRVGQKVTQGILADMDTVRYFTGEIIGAPVGLEADRGCRTKIEVRVDGDITHLWKNWTAGLHRQTCYGNISKELAYFCRFKDIKMVDEAAV